MAIVHGGFCLIQTYPSEKILIFRTKRKVSTGLRWALGGVLGLGMGGWGGVFDGDVFFVEGLGVFGEDVRGCVGGVRVPCCVLS